MNIQNITQNFQDHMRTHNIHPPIHIKATGRIERFYIEGDRRGTKNGWYVLFPDQIPGGAYGSWKLNITNTWCSKEKAAMNSIERRSYAAQINDAIQQRDDERKCEQTKASFIAKERFLRSKPADPIHPYLMLKQIPALYARQIGQQLILPIIDIAGGFHSLQFIYPDCSKKFLSGGAIRGFFIPVHGKPKEEQQWLICEGFATGASLAKLSPNACVIAAGNAQNLKPVALNIRQCFPQSEIVICADADDVGLKSARAAAISSGAMMCRPYFPETAPSTLKDFNDLTCWLSQQGEKND